MYTRRAAPTVRSVGTNSLTNPCPECAGGLFLRVPYGFSPLVAQNHEHPISRHCIKVGSTRAGAPFWSLL